MSQTRQFGPALPDRRRPVFKHQANATLNQAAPVQNTWYTVLDTKRNCRLINCEVRVDTTGETLNIRITIDGVEYTAAAACLADSEYNFNWQIAGSAVLLADLNVRTRSFLLEGQSIKVEVRKTTAAGAGNLKAYVMYAVMQ